MKFQLMFNAATYRVAHSEPKAGESVVMEAHHINPDGSLKTIPYNTRGMGLTVDAAGVERRHGVGDSTEGVLYARGACTLVALSDADYWCLSPNDGYRLVREGSYIVAPGQSAVIDKSNIVNALFTDDALVNGTLVKKGAVAKLSIGRKTVSQPNGRELHVILFRIEPV